MHIELLQHGDLSVVIRAIRTCYDSMGKSDSVTVNGEFILGAHDKDLLCRIVETRHLSTVEHLVYTFHIEGISRGCLQELARHRIASLSVKSTRYTLGRVKKEDPLNFIFEDFLVSSGNEFVDLCSYTAFGNVIRGAQAGIPNDQLKYCLPEPTKTELIWTINARSLRNFLELRLSPRAHWEIRGLAEKVKELIPESHSVLFYN